MTAFNRRSFISAGLALGAGTLAAPGLLRAQTPTKLRFANFAGPTSFLSTGIFRPWFDRIEAASEGTLKIEMYDGGSLAAAKDVYDAVRKGIADMGWGVTSYTPGRFNAATVVELPFEAASCAAASAGLWAAYEADLLDGFKGAEILAVMSSGIQLVHGTHDIKMPADLAGERVRAAGAAAARMWEAFGAIPVALPVPDIAENLSKNTLAGSMNDWNALQTWGIMEFVPYHVDVPLGSSPCFLTMNQDSFDALPAVAKEAVKAHSGAAFNAFWAEKLDGENARLRGIVAAMPEHKIHVPEAATVAAAHASLSDVFGAWAETTVNGQAVLDLYRDAVAKYTAS
ncbi:MAG: TRAP transporter substrate-binding protein DctP [Pseudodonghicola sp.]